MAKILTEGMYWRNKHIASTSIARRRARRVLALHGRDRPRFNSFRVAWVAHPMTAVYFSSETIMDIVSSIKQNIFPQKQASYNQFIFISCFFMLFSRKGKEQQPDDKVVLRLGNLLVLDLTSQTTKARPSPSWEWPGFYVSFLSLLAK
ncbi:MAG TPA: hypothetical protein IAC21_03830 [Candidatus Enterenecus merdae]|nr:hypothetical protein [Candidatus Enterenecus merdae]